MRTIVDFWAEQRQWSLDTFGRTRGPIGPLKHLRKEIDEVIAERDPEAQKTELIDCLFLVFDAIQRSGLTLQETVDIAFAKLEVNRQRSWPQGVADDHPVEHIREPKTAS